MTTLWLLTISCFNSKAVTVESKAYPYTTAERCTKMGNAVAGNLKVECEKYFVNCRKRVLDDGIEFGDAK